MEVNKCDVNHLDADALLPPRKRLLAGLKRQSYDVNCTAPSSSHIVDTEYGARFNSLLKARIAEPDLSNDEIVEASRSAAMEAAKVAETARANAEIMAAKAAKAMAVAKSALDLVAILSEKAGKRERAARKSKLNKQATVEELYSKNKGHRKSGTDEELARDLHQAINSYPRILKNTPSSDTKDQNSKKLKGSNETPLKEISMIMVDLNGWKPDTDDVMCTVEENQELANGADHQQKLENCEHELPSHDKCVESSDTSGKKRGRMKQKKLPLSIFNFKDKTNTKDDPKSQAIPQQSEDDNASQEDSLSPETVAKSLMTVEGKSTWKCQAFKVPSRVTQNKVMQS